MIPKIIHYCWIGNNPLPPLAQKCIASWQRIMPDYEIKRWDETNYDFKKNKFMANAYKQKKWGFVPDYARLDIIYNHGGIYLDTDVEVLKRFDEFLKYPAFCGFESEHFVNFGLGFGAEKGNKVIKTLMEYYETENITLKEDIVKKGALYINMPIREYEKKGLVISPFLQTQNLMENFGLKQNNTRQSLEGIEIFPTSYFCPRNKYNVPVKTKEAYSVHHFMGSWCSVSVKIKARIVKFLRPCIGNKNVERLFVIKRKIKAFFK